MIARVKLSHPAFKHGRYSSLSVLPGENRAAFEKMLEDLIAEYEPSGPFEQHVVHDLARLIWRKDNLSTFQAAKIARAPYVFKEDLHEYYTTSRGLEELVAAGCAATVRSEESPARKELGQLYDLVVAGEIATVPFLQRELQLMERLDEMIDKCLKQLLQAKALKSISVSASAPPQRLPAKAA